MSNKSGKAKKPYAKRIKQPSVAKLFRTIPAGTMLAPKAMTKLRYSAVVSHSNGISDAGLYLFRLNGVFDPDATGAGAQPPNYDNLTGIYQNYRVLWAKWKVQTVWKTGTNQAVVVYTTTNSSAPSTLQAALSQTDAEFTLAAAQESNRTHLKGYKTMAKVFGVEPAEVETDSDYGSVYTTVPARQGYLALYSGNVSGTTTSTADSIVQLTYGVEWSSPVTANMS